MLSEPFARSEGGTDLTLVMRGQRFAFRLIGVVEVGQASESFAVMLSHQFQHFESDGDMLLDLDHAELEDVFLHARNYNVTRACSVPIESRRFSEGEG